MAGSQGQSIEKKYTMYDVIKLAALILVLLGVRSIYALFYRPEIKEDEEYPDV